MGGWVVPAGLLHRARPPCGSLPPSQPETRVSSFSPRPAPHPCALDVRHVQRVPHKLGRRRRLLPLLRQARVCAWAVLVVCDDGGSFSWGSRCRGTARSQGRVAGCYFRRTAACPAPPRRSRGNRGPAGSAGARAGAARRRRCPPSRPGCLRAPTGAGRRDRAAARAYSAAGPCWGRAAPASEGGGKTAVGILRCCCGVAAALAPAAVQQLIPGTNLRGRRAPWLSDELGWPRAIDVGRAEGVVGVRGWLRPAARRRRFGAGGHAAAQRNQRAGSSGAPGGRHAGGSAR